MPKLLDSSPLPLPLSAMVELPSELPADATGLPRALEELAGRLWEVQLLADPEWLFSRPLAPLLSRIDSWGMAAALNLPPSVLSTSRLGALVEGRLHRLSIVLDRLPPAGEAGESFWAGLRERTVEIGEFKARSSRPLPFLRLDLSRIDPRLARQAGIVDRAVELGIAEVLGASGRNLVPEKAPGCARGAPSPGSPLARIKGRVKRLLSREMAPPPFASSVGLSGGEAARKDCLFPWSWTYLSRRGEVRPCPVSRRALGSLKNRDLDSIWNGPEYQDFRRRLLSPYPHEECRSCLFRPWFRPFAPAGWVWTGVNDRFGVQLGIGWHEREEGRPYRWSRREGIFLLQNTGGKKLKLVLHLPSRKLAQDGEVFIDGEKAGEFRLRRPGDRLLAFPLPAGAGEEVVVKLVADREIVPREALGNDDLRRIGVAWKGAFLEG